uniref:Uncharacterized protein n=1 Tax=Anas platyrhynchos platyrhynchos TaxID=8840 RepID=A0A493TB05_ANAPP
MLCWAEIQDESKAEAPWLRPSPSCGGPPHAAFALSYDPRAAKEKHEQEPASRLDYESELSIRIGRAGHHPGIVASVSPPVLKTTCTSVCACELLIIR